MLWRTGWIPLWKRAGSWIRIWSARSTSIPADCRNIWQIRSFLRCSPWWKTYLRVFWIFLFFWRISLLERLYHFISWQIKRDLLQRPKWLPMRFYRPNGRLFLFIPCVLRIRLLADLSVARSWILQLSVYCVMWEHPSLERHMRFWSVWSLAWQTLSRFLDHILERFRVFFLFCW